MKILILSISLLAVTSCTKDWECCVTQTTSDATGALAQLNGTITACIDFRGTNEEKNQFEADGTQVYYESNGTDTYTLTQSTECVPD